MLFLLRQESFSMGEEAADFPLGVLKGIFFNFTSWKGDPCVLCFMHPKLIFPAKPIPSLYDLCPWILPWPLHLCDLLLLTPNCPDLPFNNGMGGHSMEAESQTSQPGKLRHAQARGLRKPCRLSIAWGSEIQTSFLKRLRSLSQAKDAVTSAILAFGWQGCKSCSCWVIPAALGKRKTDCSVVLREEKKVERDMTVEKGKFQCMIVPLSDFFVITMIFNYFTFFVKVP